MTSSSNASPASRCASAGRVTAALLLSFLAVAPVPIQALHSGDFNQDVLLPPAPVIPAHPEPPPPAHHTFSLRHIYHHGTDRHPQLHRKRDVFHDESRVFLAAEAGYGEQDLSRLVARSRPAEIERLVDRRPSVVDPLVAESRRRGFAAVLDASAWTTDDIPTPDVTDKDTVLTMAYIAANAYVENEGDADWEEVGSGFNRSEDFGWESDGLRGHIWADENNSTIVIGLKGTSVAVFDGEGTTTSDKVNDNLFFSCCCGQQGQWTYRKVCDCATGTYACNSTCVREALHGEHRYYAAARELYSNVTELYPHSNVWLSGHSLGGAVSAMLGLTYGLPVVTFESVPDALAASRLGLPIPPGSDGSAPQTRRNTGIFHFGHTADPIYVGSCNGATASCSYAGYALETSCHTGQECIYDVVADKGWRVGIGTHRIVSVIQDVLLKYDDVAKCVFDAECRDCGQWKMSESNGTDRTTTPGPTTTTHIRTRTSACETPGWWGCLDTTTTPVATTTTTTIPSTTSCKTPGWFGCKDKTTTEETITTTTPQVTTTRPVFTVPTTTCETPGRFWGCRDETMETTSSWTGTITPAPVTPAPTPTATSTSPPTTSMPPKRKCRHRSWIGLCKDWEGDDESGFLPDEI